MIKEEDVIRMRTLKVSIEEDSGKLENMVDVISSSYCSELDKFITELKELLQHTDTLSDEELEKVALNVPVFMYFATEGLENLGLAYDSSKMTKQQMFNKMFEMSEGTIQDKKTQAELMSMSENYMEIIFRRAYKRLKSKLDVCEHLCLSIRKVIGKRTQDLFISSQELEE